MLNTSYKFFPLICLPFGKFCLTIRRANYRRKKGLILKEIVFSYDFHLKFI
jgi:hypothetical protein